MGRPVSELDVSCRVRQHSPIISNSFLGPVPHDTSYYAKCMLGGALACGFTHAGITPLDVTKCNMQVRYLSVSHSAPVPRFYGRVACPILCSLQRAALQHMQRLLNEIVCVLAGHA